MAAAASLDDFGSEPDFVNVILESLESKRPKNEHEKNAISVAKILTPILAQTVAKAVVASSVRGAKDAIGYQEKWIRARSPSTIRKEGKSPD